MSDIHIDDFYRDTARILNSLYREFPRPKLLFIEDISGPDTPDECGLPSNRHMSCFSAALWLSQYHYLNYIDTVAQEAIDQATLTHSAFLALNARAVHPVTHSSSEDPLPEIVIQQQLSNIQQIRYLLKNGTSTQLSEFMHHFMVQFRDFS